uniref:SAM domain-containing protein n=1 Tax=Palpitomonas bilix TaxID=652834 RepID=A0A7S3GBC8_9EUKA
MTYTDGRVYIGEWAEGRAEGLGIEKYGEGMRASTYWGEWVKGKREGFGLLLSPTGNLLAGEWQGDAPNGLGIVLTFDRFDKSSGGTTLRIVSEQSREEGEREGEGGGKRGAYPPPSPFRTPRLRQGGEEEGGGERDRASSLLFIPPPYLPYLSPLVNEAEMVKKVYCGEVRKGTKEGSGVLLLLLPRRYAAFEGTFVRGRLGSAGAVLSPDGSMYEGELKVGSGEKEGVGRYVSTQNGGVIFEGEFKRDRPDGAVAVVQFPPEREVEAYMHITDEKWEGRGERREVDEVQRPRAKVMLSPWVEGRQEAPPSPYSPSSHTDGRGGRQEWASTTEDSASVQFVPSLSPSPSPLPSSPGVTSPSLPPTQHPYLQPFSQRLAGVSKKVEEVRKATRAARQQAENALRLVASKLGRHVSITHLPSYLVDDAHSGRAESEGGERGGEKVGRQGEEGESEYNSGGDGWKKEVENWVRSLDLAEVETYVSIFLKEEINLATLAELNEGDLKAMGVTAYGAVKKTMLGIAKLREERKGEAEREEERRKKEEERKKREMEAVQYEKERKKLRRDGARRAYLPFGMLLDMCVFFHPTPPPPQSVSVGMCTCMRGRLCLVEYCALFPFLPVYSFGGLRLSFTYLRTCTYGKACVCACCGSTPLLAHIPPLHIPLTLYPTKSVKHSASIFKTGENVKELCRRIDVSHIHKVRASVALFSHICVCVSVCLGRAG